MRSEAKRPFIPVAAGCLVNERGEILIAQRPVGKIAAGKWEFPGGKIEQGETVRHALERELKEELGIDIRQARPLIRVQHDYSDRTVLLDTWLVTEFSGDLHPHDNQSFAWTRADDLSKWDLLAADRPIVAALRLPSHYVFTTPEPDEARIRSGLAQLPRGALLRFRWPALADAEYESLARRLLPAARAAGLRVILDRSPELAKRCGADGWHATSRELAKMSDATQELATWAFASCHSKEELHRARGLGFDAAVLGPVSATSTHPDRAPLGWVRFEALVSGGIPVYAIGGLGPDDVTPAHAHYAQGIAGISAYWRSQA